MLPIFITIATLGVVILSLCMGLILFGSWKGEEKNTFFNPPTTISRMERHERMSSLPSYSRRKEGQMEWKSMRKALVLQASLYFCAFLLTWIFTILKVTVKPSATVVDFLYCFFFPLQGFFNAIIFICHKVHNIKRMKPSITVCEVLSVVFIRPHEIRDVQFVGLGIVGRIGSGGGGQEHGEELGSDSHAPMNMSSHEDASREVRMSDPSLFSDEVSFMFDLDLNCKSNKNRKTTNHNEGHQEEKDSSKDDLSMHDASTVKASSRWQSTF